MVGGLEVADLAKLVEEVHVGAGVGVHAVIPAGVVVLEADEAEDAVGGAAAEAASGAGSVAEAAPAFAGEAAGVGVGGVGGVGVLRHLRHVRRHRGVVDGGEVERDGGVGPAEVLLAPGGRFGLLYHADDDGALADGPVAAAAPSAAAPAGDLVGVGAEVEADGQRHQHDHQDVRRDAGGDAAVAGGVGPADLLAGEAVGVGEGGRQLTPGGEGRRRVARKWVRAASANAAAAGAHCMSLRRRAASPWGTSPPAIEAPWAARTSKVRKTRAA